MKVSVIIPARNAEGTIGACVAAVRSQEDPGGPHDFIVVDDGSTDRTAEVAEREGARVVRVAPSGPAAARNRGATQATGEILAFTDADCTPDPTWLKELVAPFADPSVAATKGVYRTEQRSRTARFVQLEYESRYRRMAGRPSIDFVDTYSSAYRREQYWRAGGHDESYPKPSTEDQEFGFRYLQLGGTARFVPGAVVKHRHADSPWSYFRKKLKIGFWKARVLARHPEKTLGDSHTTPQVKIEMLAALGSILGLCLTPTLLGIWPMVACAAAFSLSAAPLAAQAFRGGFSFGVAAVGLLILRAFGLGLGLSAGAGALLFSSGRLPALWAGGVAAMFLVSAAPVAAGAADLLINCSLVLITVYLAAFTGFRILNRTPGESGGPGERTVYEVAVGAGVFIGAMFLLGILGLYRYGLLSAGGLLCVLALGPHGRFIASLRERWTRAAEDIAANGGIKGPDRFVALLLVLVGSMTFLNSLAPATAQDALVYHLAVPAKYIERGGIVYIPESFFAQFPGNMEMLFTLALLVRGDSLAGAYHWLFAAASVAAVGVLGRRIGGSFRSALAAAAVFGTVPSAALIAGWAYVDLAVVFFCLASTLAFLRWWDRGEASPASLPGAEASFPRARWLGLAALFAGLAAGCKYTGGAQGLFLVFAVFFEGGARKRLLFPVVRNAIAAATVTGAVASPWWIKNALWTGNPLFPFFYGVLGGRQWDAGRADVLSRFLGNWGGSSEGIWGLLALPWTITMSGRFFSIERFDGMIGPAFLLGAPFVLACLFGSLPSSGSKVATRGLRIVLGFALAHGLLWIVMTRQVRFLLPALALGAGLIGGCICFATFPRRWQRLVQGAFLTGLLANVVLIAAHFAAHNPIPVVMGMESESSYLLREIPGGDYPVFEAVERSLPEGSNVLFGATGNPGFLCKRPYHSDPIFENWTLDHILAAGCTPGGVRDELRRRGFTHLLFRWDLVFDPTGKRSEIPMARQMLLADALNRHGRIIASAGGTFLYAIEGEP